MEDVGHQQSNLVNKIIANMYGLPFPYPTQETAYTSVPNPAPTIVPTIQPTPVSNVATYAVYNISPQILTSMQKMQQLLIQTKTNQTGGGGKTSNRNTRRSPTNQAETEPR